MRPARLLTCLLGGFLAVPAIPAQEKPSDTLLTVNHYLDFETVGDARLARFKADPANAGKVMNRGLWRYTRHPNYFGDAVVWWSFFCFAAATDGGWWTVFSPVLMTLLLMRVSGVTLLEKKLEQTKPAYREYAERTNAFFPWWPADRANRQA